MTQSSIQFFLALCPDKWLALNTYCRCITVCIHKRFSSFFFGGGGDLCAQFRGGHWRVPNTAIPYEKLANTEIPCRKWTKYRYRIYHRWRLLTTLYPSRVFFFFLSQAFIHQKSTLAFARKHEKISNWSIQRSKSQVIGCPTNFIIE